MITGWGRITSNQTKKEAKKDLRKFKAATRTLLKVNLPVANNNENCKFYDLNLDKQMCVGGVKGMLLKIMQIYVELFECISLT